MSVVQRMTTVELEFFVDGGVDTLPDVADALLCRSRTYPGTVQPGPAREEPMMIDDGFLRGPCGWDRASGWEMRKTQP